MSDWYYLDGKVTHKAKSFDDAKARWDYAKGLVARTRIGNHTDIITLFMCIDLSRGHGPPTFFETAICGREHNGYERRCMTWDEAEAQHAAAVEMVLPSPTEV
jgi:hypothetical protein